MAQQYNQNTERYFGSRLTDGQALLANVRYGSHFGLSADVASLSRWANKRH